MLKSDDLADLIWKRVKPFLDDIIIEDDPHKIHIHGVTSLLKGKWRPLELNNVIITYFIILKFIIEEIKLILA